VSKSIVVAKKWVVGGLKKIGADKARPIFNFINLKFKNTVFCTLLSFRTIAIAAEITTEIVIVPGLTVCKIGPPIQR
jgi:hypothetical protein